jgi:hypothetical protein
MEKEWANNDRYNPSHCVPKPRMPLPRGKVVVRSVPACGDASSHSRGSFSREGGQTGLARRSDRPCPEGGG